MNRNRSLGPLLIILCVLLVAVGWGRLKESGWRHHLPEAGLPAGYTLEEEAGPGQLVEGFPKRYITLVSDAEIKQSLKYIVGQDDGKSQVFSATYDTAATLPNLFTAYLTYLVGEGYDLRQTKSRGTSSSITAAKGDNTISVDMRVVGAGQNEVRIDLRTSMLQ